MLAVTVLLCSLLAGPASQATPPAARRSPTDADDSPTAPMSPAKMLKYQHDDALKDIDKLVKLIGEVHEEIEKAGENVLPLNSLKKLEDVERLSRRIRNKIKQ